MLNTNYRREAAAQWILLLAFLIILGRVVVVILSPFELYADEAQYWRWAQTPAWGYYSKPPMIAWVIGTSTSMFGDAEWAIRLPAPMLHGCVAICLYKLGKEISDAFTGALAALCYLMMPAVILSSAVISTDGVLMPLFTLTLWQAWVFRARPNWISAFVLGLAIGFGFLSKYAMLYFVIGITLTLLFDRQTRQAWLSSKGLLILVLSALILSPHIWWSVQTEFQTLGHTVDNVNLSGPLFNPDHLGKFILDQLGVFGPICFVFFVVAVLVLLIQQRLNQAFAWLLCFCLPVLVIIGGQAVLSRAHANWAVTAYPAASVIVALATTQFGKIPRLWAGIIITTSIGFAFLPNTTLLVNLAAAFMVGVVLVVAAMISKWRAIGLYWTSIILHASVAIAFPALMLLPSHQTDALGLSNATKRVIGWEKTVEAIIEQAETIDATAIITDERELWHALNYYSRGKTDIPIYSWRRYGVPKSFAEQQELKENTMNVLVASYRPYFRPMLRQDFSEFSYRAAFAYPLGHRANGCKLERRIIFYLADDHTPKARNTAWNKAIGGKTEFPNQPC